MEQSNEHQLKYITPEKNKLYYNNFKINNPDVVRWKFACDLCGGKYTYYNKSKHNKSTKHLTKKNETENKI